MGSKRTNTIANTKKAPESSGAFQFAKETALSRALR